MKALQLKVPPPLVMTVFGLLMWWIDQKLPTFAQEWAWSEWLSRTVFLLAVAIVVSAMIGFKRAHTTVDPMQPENASVVVTTGIYQWTRNPMYLGFLLMLMAFVIKLANPVTVVMLPLFVWYMNWFQIRPEEQVLSKLFGDTYIAYMHQVRRWI